MSNKREERGFTQRVNPYIISRGLLDKLDGSPSSPPLAELLSLGRCVKMSQAAAILDNVLEKMPRVRLRIERVQMHEWEGTLLGTEAEETVNMPSLAATLVALLQTLIYEVYR